MQQLRASSLLAGLLAAGTALLRWGLELVTEGAAAVGRLGDPAPGDAELLLHGVVGTGLLGSGTWSAAVSLVALADLVRHRPAAVGGAVRPAWVRSVVVRGFAPALGAAALCAGGPAAADPGDIAPERGTGFAELTGLPLPTRPVTRPAVHRPGPAVAKRVVRAGECLWSVADDLLGGSAAPDRVDRAWRDLYRANRERIGDDPHLVRPGTRLLVPPESFRPRISQHPPPSR